MTLAWRCQKERRKAGTHPRKISGGKSGQSYPPWIKNQPQRMEGHESWQGRKTGGGQQLPTINLARLEGGATGPGASGRLFSSKHRIYAVCRQ